MKHLASAKKQAQIGHQMNVHQSAVLPLELSILSTVAAAWQRLTGIFEFRCEW